VDMSRASRSRCTPRLGMASTSERPPRDFWERNVDGTFNL